MRGYFGIGIDHAKSPLNIGTLWRSAGNLGAAFIFTVGKRWPDQASDTIKAWKHVPYYEFDTVADLVEHLPRGCPLIGVEQGSFTEPITSYVHPERACYLLGAEDQGLTKAALEACHQFIEIPSSQCLNVAVAGSIVMYDRLSKTRVAA